jgi:pimeloyl-ACP methyl ester carboxylesterase
MTEDTGNHAAVNGIEMYYEIHGEGEPLILLHGGVGAIEMFGEVLPLLAEGRRVIAVDLQAHGRYRPPDDVRCDGGRRGSPDRVPGVGRGRRHGLLSGRRGRLANGDPASRGGKEARARLDPVQTRLMVPRGPRGHGATHDSRGREEDQGPHEKRERGRQNGAADDLAQLGVDGVFMGSARLVDVVENRL